MSHSSAGEKNPNPSPNFYPQLNTSRQDILNQEDVLKHVILKMHLHHQSLSSTPSASPTSRSESDYSFNSLILDPPAPDCTLVLSDELLLKIFRKLPVSEHVSYSLVCKRWCYLHGQLVESLKLNDWYFLDSGRMFYRFPNISEIDIVRSCICIPRKLGILVTHKFLALRIDSHLTEDGFIDNGLMLRPGLVDQGLEMIAKTYSNLRRIVAIGAGQNGLSCLANECNTLQELELHCCGDISLKGISGCRNLQVVKLIGNIDGFYSSVVSDIGLTILAQGCKRLVKLELYGCEGSYDGIKAIGQCCQMLEEFTLSDHRMDGGWLAALSFCRNLKTLRLQSCKIIDSSPGPDEHLGSCLTLEEVHLQRCQLRDKKSTKALFLVCDSVREIVLQNCWGLEDDVFAMASVCRGVKLLSLECCSLLSTSGLESVVLSWKELQRLRVVSCDNIKDSEVTPELASLFSVLIELKWRPDSRSLLAESLVETEMGKRGGKFFSRLKT